MNRKHDADGKFTEFLQFEIIPSGASLVKLVILVSRLIGRMNREVMVVIIVEDMKIIGCIAGCENILGS